MAQPIDLSETTAIVTGGARGIGRAIAGELLSHNASVALVDILAKELLDTANELAANSNRVIPLCADVTDDNQVTGAVEQAVEKLGPVNLLVNNAGINKLGSIDRIGAEEWWRVVEVNLKAPFLFAHAVLPYMIQQNSGRIVIVSSQGGTTAPHPNGSAFSVSKAANLKLAEAIALEGQQHNVFAFSIHPGRVWSPGAQEMVEKSGPLPPAVQAMLDSFPFDDTGMPAQLVARLANGDADALSGSYIEVYDDLDKLVEQAEDIKRFQWRRLRLREPKQQVRENDMNDRQKIEQTLAEFMWGRDSQDWQATEVCLTEDVNYISSSPSGDGSKSHMQGRAAFMQVLKMNAMGGLVDSVQHHQSNLVIGIDGDNAWAKAYQLRFISVKQPDMTGVIESGASVSYQLRKEEDRWLISECETDTCWTKNNELLAELMQKMQST